MSFIEVVRAPNKPWSLALRVDGQLLQGVTRVELIHVPKQLTRIHVEFTQFDLLGEHFPEAGPLDEKMATAIAEHLHNTTPTDGVVSRFYYVKEAPIDTPN